MYMMPVNAAAKPYITFQPVTEPRLDVSDWVNPG
jgi:hypothetical protein